MQCRERGVRRRSVRRVRDGLRPARNRRGTADRRRLRRRAWSRADAVWPVPSAAVGERRPWPAAGDGPRGATDERGAARRVRPRGPCAMTAFDAVDVISTKRDGGVLSDDQIDWVIAAYTRGEVAEEQMSALAMAILLNGMTRGEISRWTEAMIASGVRMQLPRQAVGGRPTTDKHSTGGVGDKITLPLSPLVAACGAAVPQLSGRGLGHTGGTLDKLESIAGWRATMSGDEFMAQLREVGAVICAASDDLAPADKKLYALRDVTGTVEAIPLIASSIMSK